MSKLTNENTSETSKYADPHGIFNFSGFGIWKLQTYFELKDSKKIHYENLEL